MSRSSQPAQTRGLPDGVGENQRAPAATEQRFQLILLSGPGRGRSIPVELTPGSSLRIGSARDNDVVLEDDTVSRRHCAISREGESWLLRDLKSTNGTFLEDARVKDGWLRPGAVIRAGQALLRFASAHQPVSLPPSSRDHFGSLSGKSLRMREVFAVLERAARTEATVLITGETGTGKSAVARAIHENSRRSSGPFVVVDCGAVAPNLIESELFGHEKGAFTGAEQRRVGALEQARGGVLFLDELDDLRKDLQPKLLHALEERTFKRLGSNQAIEFDARVVAATKKDLRALVSQGAFRDDLYFRIAVLKLQLPPLRDRPDDIPALVDRFARALGSEEAWRQLPADIQQWLLSHPWPGNVRELRNAMERAFALGDPDQPGAGGWQLETEFGRPSDSPRPSYELPFKEAKEKLVDTFEREYLARLLARAQGKLTEAARLAQIDRKHLYNLLQKHRLGDGDPTPD